MAQIHRKIPTAATCYELALERLTYVFDRFDRVVVSFSGGKDSTACLNLALEIARAQNRLPLDVYTFDEEAIPPETVDYMARVAARPEIRFAWYCMPIVHRNACSTGSPLWCPWAPEDRATWVRPLPPGAITDYPGFTRGELDEQVATLYPPSCGTVANIMGIRTQESLTRYSAIASKVGPLAFINGGPRPHIKKIYPIYDWALEDVWLAPLRCGWDYNRAYDLMEAAGLTRADQRCSPSFGEQSIHRLHTFKTCWPDLWAKMVDRVPGAATAARYANTELYGYKLAADDLPAGLTWQAWTIATLRDLEPARRAEAAEPILSSLKQHARRTSRPMPDAEPDPASGFCWKTLFLAAKVGGNKFDRMGQKMRTKALQARRRSGAPRRA